MGLLKTWISHTLAALKEAPLLIWRVLLVMAPISAVMILSVLVSMWFFPLILLCATWAWTIIEYFEKTDKAKNEREEDD